MLDLYSSGDTTFVNDKGQNIQISKEYVSAWCERNKIIGMNTRVASATLNKKIDAISIFDLKKISTHKKKGEMLQKATEKYGSITSLLESFIPNDEVSDFVSKANADELMKFISKDENCRALYSKQASTMSEGWTVGQHTQAVLDFFDKNRSHNIPEGLQPFMKVCILAHDIGKANVGENKKYPDQKTANIAEAEHLYNALGIGQEYRDLINFVIGYSQDYTSVYYFAKENSSSYLELHEKKKSIATALNAHCHKQLSSCFGEQLIGENDVHALTKLCVALQQCDSGAYTTFAKVKGEDGQYHRGRNEKFTESFVTGDDGYKRLKTYKDEVMEK